MGRHGRTAVNLSAERAQEQLIIAVGAADRRDETAAYNALRAAWAYYGTRKEDSAELLHFGEQAATTLTLLGHIDVAGELVKLGIQPLRDHSRARRHAIRGAYSY